MITHDDIIKLMDKYAADEITRVLDRLEAKQFKLPLADNPKGIDLVPLEFITAERKALLEKGEV